MTVIRHWLVYDETTRWPPSPPTITTTEPAHRHGYRIEGPFVPEPATTQGAVSDESAQRFRDALAPGYIVWHDGKRLSAEDSLTQIKRGLAALGGQ